jgi:hypothetical protein
VLVGSKAFSHRANQTLHHQTSDIKSMIKNYLLLALKNFRKQKMFSLINVLGLTIGITCCLMIFLFISNEWSYDNFHKNGKDIYRVMRTGTVNGNKENIPYLSAPFGPALLNDFPDYIQQSVRVIKDNDLIAYKNISFLTAAIKPSHIEKSISAYSKSAIPTSAIRHCLVLSVSVQIFVQFRTNL